MASITNYLENKLCEHVLLGQGYVPPASIYIGLHSGNPGETGTDNELVGNGYKRAKATFGGAISGIVINDSEVLFDAATGTWPTLTYISVHDSQMGGNALFYGALSPSVVVSTGNNFRIPPGNLALGFD